MYSVFPIDFVLTHFIYIYIYIGIPKPQNAHCPQNGPNSQNPSPNHRNVVPWFSNRASTESALRKSMAMVESLGSHDLRKIPQTFGIQIYHPNISLNTPLCRWTAVSHNFFWEIWWKDHVPFWDPGWWLLHPESPWKSSRVYIMDISHTIHVWDIYPHLVDFYGKCR